MSDSIQNQTRMHPIGVVSRRTGLKPDLIRAWERRYGAVSPERSQTRRRFYTDDDIERLQLLRKAVNGGRSIGQIAELTELELRELIEGDGPQQTAYEAELPVAHPFQSACSIACIRHYRAGSEKIWPTVCGAAFPLL